MTKNTVDPLVVIRMNVGRRVSPHIETLADVIEQEREIARARALAEGKPEKVVDKIVEGRLQKFYEEVCLLEQPFVKEATLSVGQLVKTKIAKLGENIGVARFVRFKVGDVAAVEAGALSGSDGAGPETA